MNESKNKHLNTLAITRLPADLVSKMVANTIEEDIKTGDITASLIAADTVANGRVITRENMILCGKDFANETIKQIDETIKINWNYSDGDNIKSDETLFTISGNARNILSAERTMLNFVQMLSGTATVTSQYVAKLAGTNTRILDTRKTIPGYRLAQKYAVHCGGGSNHRIGLYDAFLIKENHISACRGITNAINTARANYPDKLIEVEVENLAELQEAIDAGANVIMLDDFSLEETRKAVKITRDIAELEASGNLTLDTINEVAQTGVDFISIGALTKHIRAIDLSMRFL